MSTFCAILLFALGLPLAHTRQTNILFHVSWGPATNVDYYVVHMSPAPYCTPEVTTNVGLATNVILSLPRTWDFGAKNAGEERWTAVATNWFIGVVCWNSQHQGGYWPYMHYPPDVVQQFSGWGLECATNISGPWTQTNWTWTVTNVTGQQFFRSQDLGGPTHTNWSLFGNFDNKDWWVNLY